jgi:MSHA biogenesis protein MshL
MRFPAPWCRACALALLPLLFATGCENTPPRTETLDDIAAEIDGGLSEKAAASGVPDAVAADLIPTLRLDVAEVPPMDDEQRFDIAVNNVPADQFFMSLIDGSRYNMVVHPEVTGEISLNLKNVTIPAVLEAARDVYGFEFDRTDYGFHVLPARLEARVYQINYLNLNRSGSSSTFVSSGTLQEGPGAASIGNAEEGAGVGGRGQRTVVGTQINTLHPETSFWHELQDSLEAIVGDAEGRSVVVNPQSGVVVARAIPTELREIEAYLQATQLIAQRQVILEAKILEVELSEGFQSGINWAAVAGDFSFFHTGGGTNLVGESALSDIAGADVTQEPGVTDLAGVAASAFGGVFSMAFNGSDFTAFIELLEAQGNVQVLSSPRISTMNNQKAIIKVGTDEFFVTDVSTTTITSTTTQTTPNIELTPFFSGIALDVTPQISEGGDVTLHIHPTVSQVRDQHRARERLDRACAQWPTGRDRRAHAGPRQRTRRQDTGARRRARDRRAVPAQAHGHDQERTGDPAATAGHRRGPAMGRGLRRQPRQHQPPEPRAGGMEGPAQFRLRLCQTGSVTRAGPRGDACTWNTSACVNCPSP